MSAIVELLYRNELCTKQDLHEIINDLRRKQSRTRTPENVFPEYSKGQQAVTQ